MFLLARSFVYLFSDSTEEHVFMREESCDPLRVYFTEKLGMPGNLGGEENHFCGLKNPPVVSQRVKYL